MTYTTLENVSDLSLKGLLQFPSTDTPIFYPLILFAIFMVFTLSTFFRELRREGKGNILSSLAVAGFVTTAMATIFSLLDLIQVQIVVLTFVISTVFAIIYLLTK
ncbi:hypothetical protein LCGC14_2466980 [marine sediment metagenome]|uniref:Uncharacterized protein n=1 Tax=marine sediment metagenome TaxID=412755 RepID=A0A0F9E5J4_9ZZZZ